MSWTYEDQSDCCNVICPYCEASYQREAEDYSEDSRVEKCDSCGKKYRTCDVFTVDHETSPDCELNGEQHDYEEWHKKPGTFFCKTCGDCTREVSP